MWLDMAISILLRTLKEVIKNKKKKKELKSAMLKVRNSINETYVDDKDFA